METRNLDQSGDFGKGAGRPPSVAAQRYFTAKYAWLEHGDTSGALVEDPYLGIDAAGVVVDLRSSKPEGFAGPIEDLGHALLIPGMVNAHSHAFQWAIRGKTGRRGAEDPSSFWSWRDAMYRCANELDPEGVYQVTRKCYEHMLARGMTCVGEFHYLHHQSDGRPYDEPDALSEAVIRAAADTGIRLVLLEVLYEQSAPKRPALAEQARFCDASLDAYFARCDRLRAKAAVEGFQVGLAAHSVRAVSRPSLLAMAEYAKQHDLQLHAHLSEQPRENEECQQAYGCSPTQLLHDCGWFEREGRFCGVHSIYLDKADRERMAKQFCCACPTTEADLGDGIVAASELAAAGVGLALGSDSQTVVDLIQEARLLEMNERLRRTSRLCLPDAEGRVAANLLEIATRGGALALGRGELGALRLGSPLDLAVIDLDAMELAETEAQWLVDTLMLCGDASLVRETWVGGQKIG